MSPFTAKETRGFVRLVQALEPYSRQLVFIGGWAHRLFELHPQAAPLPFDSLATEDVDVAAPARVRTDGESIRERLAAAGFQEHLSGEERPPISHYTLGTEASGFYVEFLVPLIGGGMRRDGQSDSTASVSGVSAQKLRYLEFLLMDPWRVSLTRGRGFVGVASAEIQVPNPTAYLAQKLLAFRYRKPRDQEKDVLYIHDTLLLFGDALGTLSEHWQSLRPKLHRNEQTALAKQQTALFTRISDAVTGASQIAKSTGRATRTQPGGIAATCNLGLAQVFG
jgi:hypothetical protein